MDPKQNSYLKPNFSGRSDNFYSLNNYSASPKPEKSKLKLLIIVLIAAVFLIGIFAIIGSVKSSSKKNSTTTEEFYTALSDFKLEYDIFLSFYESYIGFEPEFKIDDDEFFPISKNSMEDFLAQSKVVEDISSIIINFQENSEAELSDNQKTKTKLIKERITNNLGELNKNIELLTKFYNAFYEPIFNQLESDKKQAVCTKTDAIQDLIESDDELVSSAANLSNEVYCDFVTKVTKRTDEDELEDMCLENNAKVVSAFVFIKNRTTILKEEDLTLNNLIDEIYEDRGDEEL